MRSLRDILILFVLFQKYHSQYIGIIAPKREVEAMDSKTTIFSNLSEIIKIIPYENENIIKLFSSLCHINNLIATVFLGNHTFYEKINFLFLGPDFLNFFIPTNIYLKEIINTGFVMNHINEDYIGILFEVILSINRTKVAIFFTNDIDDKNNNLLKMIIDTGTRYKISIYSYEFSFKDDNSIDSYIKTNIKSQVYVLIVLTNNNYLMMKLMAIAKKERITEQNYYWIIEGSQLNFMSLIKTFDQSNNPNILIIQSSLYKNVKVCSKNCSIFQFPIETIVEFLINQIKELKINISINDSNYFTCASKNEFRKFFKDTINAKKIKDLIGSFEEYYIYSTTSKDLSFNQTNRFNYSTDFVLVDRRNKMNNKNVYQIDKLYLNYFKGWNNKTLHICSPPITPAMVFPGGYKYYTLNETAGLVTDILKILSKKLNFRMLIYEAPDKQFGAKIGNTTDFTGCVGEILTGKATFGAGAFTFTSQRQEFVDYSYPIMEESNVPVLQRPKMESKRWHIFRPFNWSVWLLSVATIFIISYFCYLFSKYNPLSAYNLNLNFAIVDEIHIKEHLWNAIGGFVLQGQDFYPYTVSARIVLAIWWLFCLIIFSAYTADLTSFLTVNPGDNLLSSLDELAGRTDLKILIPQGTNLDALLIESSNPTYQALNSRKVYIDTIDNCPKKMLEPTSINLVCITDTSVVVYVVNKFCSVIYTVPETFNTAPLGFLTPKDAPFKEKMDQIIQSLVETGIVSRWIEFYWKTNQSNAQNCDSNTDNSADPIDLDGVLGAYILTWIFMLLAFIVFLLELLYKKLKLNIFHC